MPRAGTPSESKRSDAKTENKNRAKKATNSKPNTDQDEVLRRLDIMIKKNDRNYATGVVLSGTALTAAGLAGVAASQKLGQTHKHVNNTVSNLNELVAQLLQNLPNTTIGYILGYQRPPIQTQPTKPTLNDRIRAGMPRQLGGFSAPYRHWDVDIIYAIASVLVGVITIIASKSVTHYKHQYKLLSGRLQDAADQDKQERGTIKYIGFDTTTQDHKRIQPMIESIHQTIKKHGANTMIGKTLSNVRVRIVNYESIGGSNEGEFLRTQVEQSLAWFEDGRNTIVVPINSLAGGDKCAQVALIHEFTHGVDMAYFDNPEYVEHRKQLYETVVNHMGWFNRIFTNAYIAWPVEIVTVGLELYTSMKLTDACLLDLSTMITRYGSLDRGKTPAAVQKMFCSFFERYYAPLIDAIVELKLGRRPQNWCPAKSSQPVPQSGGLNAFSLNGQKYVRELLSYTQPNANTLKKLTADEVAHFSNTTLIPLLRTSPGFAMMLTIKVARIHPLKILKAMVGSQLKSVMATLRKGM
jgi:hypothetical protein